MFLGKTLNSHGTSLHPGVQMGTGECNARDGLAPHPGGVEIILELFHATETGITSSLMGHLAPPFFEVLLLCGACI